MTTHTLPTWFTERQAAALARFESMPAPKRGDEPWRFSNLKQLDFSGYEAGSPAEDSASVDFASRSNGLEKTAAKLVFANDQLLHFESDLPAGAVCLPLAEALLSHGELVEAHFMKQEPRLGSARFAAWHEASVTNGLFLMVPDQVELDAPIEVHHWIAGAQKIVFPHTLVIAGANSKVRVVEIFHSADPISPGLAIAFNDLSAGPGASLDHVVIQDLNEVTRIVQISESSTASNGSMKTFLLNIGASWARNEFMSRLDGEGARSDMLSVSVPTREQEYDQRTFQHHVSPGAYSDLLFKNSLYDHAKTVFSGLIFVDEGAHHTDAYQTCRNLLMSDTAEANSMPGLEINADQVKCSHGSTSAPIDADEIFYLRARGIDPARAYHLVARGFSVEAIERINDDAIEGLVLRFLDEKFSRL